MKLLELFAGSRSVGKVAEEMGFEVFSTDLNPFENIDLVGDILKITRDDIPFVPDVIWASPPLYILFRRFDRTSLDSRPSTEDRERKARCSDSSKDLKHHSVLPKPQSKSQVLCGESSRQTAETAGA